MKKSRYRPPAPGDESRPSAPAEETHAAAVQTPERPAGEPSPDSTPTPLDAPAPEARASSSPPVPPGWARPQAVRRDSSFYAWLYFFAGVCLIVALWIPVRSEYFRMAFKPTVEGVRDADSFIALAYGGVSSGKNPGPEEVSRPAFEQQIRALRERGFNPIGLSDVKAFYEEGRPLPRKAVLLTFEQSKRVSYLETRGILRGAHWKATMFVRSDTIEDQDPSALRWPILRDMVRSGSWEVGAESAHGYRRIPTGPDGETGNFFSSPMWIGDQRRLETPEEFEKRVRADHELMVSQFQKGMDAAPIAFAYPYGDYGQYDPRAVPTRMMNMRLVKGTYGLGFSVGPFVLNTRHTHPGALHRMLVNPKWTLDEFISIVESAWAKNPWEIEQPLKSARWLATWGRAETAADGSLWLRAIGPESGSPMERPTTGALAWLAASDTFQDFVARIRFRVVEGEFGIRFRAMPGGEQGVRILLDENGNCWVNQKVIGAEEFTEAFSPASAPATDREQCLEISLRGRNLFATLNGHLLLREPLDLLGESVNGLFGFEVWAPRPGSAATQVVSLEFPRPNHALKYWSVEHSAVPVSLMQALEPDAPTTAVISPPWMEATQSVPLVLPKWDDDAIRIFARMRGIGVFPRLDVRSSELALKIPPELIAHDSEAMRFDGVTLDCRRVDVNDIQPLVPWIRSVYTLMEERKMKLALQFPAGIVRMASFASIAALFPQALIAVDTPEQAAQVEKVLPEAFVAQEVKPPPAADLHLDLYYQLATRSLPMEELTPQARQESYRRAGYQAFQEGDYDRSIEQWGKWLAEDAGSAEALQLIGRAYAQKEDWTRALDYYTRSLQVSPGQIQLVVRRAELLEKMDRVDEAREQLNLYARIFPENPDIVIAQAQWLDRRKRQKEARDMLQALVHDMPQNLDARMALLGLQTVPAERYQSMRDILDLGSQPDSQMPFGYSILSKEMLTFPESSVFFDYVRTQAREGKQTKQRDLYESFLPLEERVTDDFTSGKLSDGWIASGGMRASEHGRYDLRAAIDQTETYLRLKRSELMRDGVLDVTIDESQGLFWLYARRSANGMVRFGFDQEGFIHLQSWHRGELVARQIRPWIRPPGSLRMRLEVRGDGARGFVNDMEIFNGPVAIPGTVAYGWWGIAPFATDVGIARARILRLDCAPMPTAVVLLPPGGAEQQAAQLRPYIGKLSALAPAWVFQRPDGTLPDGVPEDADVLRMFAAFHQMRLLPVIDLSYEGNADPVGILDFVQRNKLDGVVLKRRSPPPREWMDRLVAELEKRPADVLLLQTESALWDTPGAVEAAAGEQVIRPLVGSERLPKPGERLPLYEMPIGSVLIPPLQASWEVPLLTPGSTEDALPAGDLMTPRLYLMTKEGRLLPAPAGS